MLTSTLALLLFSVSGTQAINIRSQKYSNKLSTISSQSEVQGANTCLTAIQNFKSFNSFNWSPIAAQTTPWTDPLYPSANKTSTNNIMFWPEFTTNDDGVQSNAPSTFWLRAMSTSALSKT